MPGQLKNALDWASRPYAEDALRGKPVAVVGASPSPSGARRAIAELRLVLRAIGAEVLDEELPVARAGGQFGEGDELRDAAVGDALVGLLGALLATTAGGGEALVAT